MELVLVAVVFVLTVVAIAVLIAPQMPDTYHSDPVQDKQLVFLPLLTNPVNALIVAMVAANFVFGYTMFIHCIVKFLSGKDLIPDENFFLTFVSICLLMVVITESAMFYTGGSAVLNAEMEHLEQVLSEME